MMAEEKGAIPSEVVEKSSTLHTASFTPHPRGSGLSGEKQIEEMYNDLNKIFDEEYRERRIITAYHTAKGLYEQGYRKQSEGYWFFTEYEYFTCSNCGKSHFNFCDSSAEARKRLAEGEYYPYCPECGAKMKGGTE